MNLRFKSFINLPLFLLTLMVISFAFTSIDDASIVKASSESTYTFNFLDSGMTTDGGEASLTSEDKIINWSYTSSSNLSITSSGALTISNTSSWSMSTDISKLSSTITYIYVDATIGGYGTFYLSLGKANVSKNNKERLELTDLNATSGTIKISFDGCTKNMTINSITIKMIPNEVVTTPIISWGSNPSTSMKIGEIETLDIVKNDAASEGNINITSSDTSVISVNDLVITALKEGTSTIVVTCDIDGCNSLSIDITVFLTVKYLSTGSEDYLKVNDLSNLLDGDKFLIVNEVDKRYAFNSLLSNGSFDRSSGVTISDGVIKTSEVYQSKLLLTITKSSSGYLLKNEENKYLSINEDKFILNNDSSTYWDITINDGVASISSGSYHIVYENNTFKLSNSATSNIAIYRFDSTSINEVEVSSSLKEAIIKINDNYLSCDSSGTNSNIDWINIKATFGALSESDRNILTNLILPTDGGYNVIEAFMSRYDYIISKYNYEDFLSRYPSSNSSSLPLLNNDDYANDNAIMMVVISLCSLSLLIGIILLKKKREY